MEFKGTKGKWKRDGNILNNTSPVEIMCGTKIIARVVAYEFYHVFKNEAQSNLKLIESAPEMFEMLKELKDRLEYYMDEVSALEIEQLLTKITK